MREPGQGPRTLTIPQVAEAVGMSPATLRRAIREGTTPFHPVRVGKFVRIPAVEVEALVGGLDVDAARGYLRATLPDQPIEIDDEGALDRAAAVVVATRAEQ